MNKNVSGFVLFGILLVLSFFTSSCAVSSEDTFKTEIRDGVKYFGEGCVKYREGIPFLYLKGSSYEIGLQYGVLLREEMNDFYMRVDSFEHAMVARVYKESPWYLDIIIWISTPFVKMSKLNSFKKRVPEDYMAQLKGMADGSGIPLNDILEVTFGPDWLSCSSFIKEIDGRFIHGRNADHDIIEFFSRYPLVAHYERDGKYKYIDMGIIGNPFAVTGVNEHGLTISWSQATTSSSRTFKSTGTMLMFNKILEECRNLSDVDATSKNVDRFVVMIGSLEDKIGAAYDIVDQEAVRTDMRNGYVYATNRCVSQSLKRKYNSVFDMDWFNSARAYTFEKILSSSEEFAIDDAIRLLSDIDFYDYTGKIPPREGGNINNRGTGSSVVIDPLNRTVYFAFGAPYAAFSRWIAYDYSTDEIYVYKEEDERIHDPDFVEYVNLERRWEDVDWDDDDELRNMVSDIENVSAENFWTLHQSCWAWNALGNTVRAEAIINRQIEKYPDFLSGYTNMGFLYMDQGNFDKAIEYYERALDAPITNDRKKLYCYEQLAAAYSEIGNVSKALDYYRAALDFYNRYYIPKHAREKVDMIENRLRPR